MLAYTNVKKHQRRRKAMGEKIISFDIKSTMDVIYGESSSRIDSRFIFANEGKQMET